MNTAQIVKRTVASKSAPITLRQEVCACSDRSCSMLFDQRKVISASVHGQGIPGCWKKGSDLFVNRVSRSEAQALAAMETAYSLIQIGK